MFIVHYTNFNHEALLNSVTEQLATGTFPVVVEQVDLVRVEKSLHSLGFFASTANREISRTVVQIFRRPDGQRIHAKAVIEGIPSLGLPTTADRIGAEAARWSVRVAARLGLPR
jgi:hypothetical protein